MRTKAVLLALGTTALAVVGAVPAFAPSASAAPVACGMTVTQDVTLEADLVGCTGDGLIVGAADVRINLNGFVIGGTKAPSSVGIRNDGYDDVRVDGGGPFATIQEFEIGILMADAQGTAVTNLATRSVTFGVRLERTTRAVVRHNDVGFFESGPELDGCLTDRAPAGILLLDSNHATVRGNMSQLTGFGILLVRSHVNQIKANDAAPTWSDGNSCSGIVLVDSDRNTVVDNVTAMNRNSPVVSGDGIFIDSASRGTVLRHNRSETNTDDGIDVESPATKLLDNRADRNDDLGIEAVAGVSGSGNKAKGNGNALQCVNISCT